MPYPNFHAARMLDPGKFEKDSFRTINIGNKNSGITAIVGKLKGESTTKVQTYRFDKDKFTAKQARQWLEDHDLKPIEFEDASGKEFDEADGVENEAVENKMPEELEYKTFGFDLFSVEKKSDDGDGLELGVFFGAMATEHKDRGNDIIAPDAFDKTLQRYKKSKRDIRLFYQHDTKKPPIGIIPIKSVEKDGKFWNVKGELNLGTQRGREIYSLMKQGALSDMSIGYTPIDVDFKNNSRVIKELELWEVSVVSEPMNPKAAVTEVKASEEEKYTIADIEHISTREEFNEILSKSGLFSRAACEFLASCFSPKQSKSADEDMAKVQSALLELKTIITKL